MNLMNTINHNLLVQNIFQPCSSTKPTSWSDLPQEACAQTKCPGHHVLPSAVINGPLSNMTKLMFIWVNCKFIGSTGIKTTEALHLAIKSLFTFQFGFCICYSRLGLRIGRQHTFQFC